MVRKLLRYLLIFLLVFIGLIILFLAFSIAPINRSQPQEHAYYNEMLERITPQHALAKGKLSVGFARENLTPSYPTALAGYGNRRGKKFDSVHDSIYVRAMVISNGATRVAIVSADLLIIPPTVTERLEQALPAIGFTLDNTYLGATHTHNSIGNWAKGATEFLYGAYDDSIVTLITDKIVRCIQQASANTAPASLRYGQIPVGKAVDNRIIDGGPVDSLLRVIDVVRNDSTRLLLMSYTAHATCLFSKDLSLSRDYPGKLVDEVEAGGYTFAMFLAGSVGSHGCNAPEYGQQCVDWMTGHLLPKLTDPKTWLVPVQDSSLLMYRVPLALGPPQVKISKDWRVRPWLFHAAFGGSDPYLTALRLGDITLLGTPCDFSGEFNPALDSVAAKNGAHTIVTSFNGAYIGYITPLKYYDVDHYETRLMNWYGPGTGEYLETCLEKMLNAVE